MHVLDSPLDRVSSYLPGSQAGSHAQDIPLGPDGGRKINLDLGEDAGRNSVANHLFPASELHRLLEYDFKGIKKTSPWPFRYKVAGRPGREAALPSAFGGRLTRDDSMLQLQDFVCLEEKSIIPLS